MKNGSELEDFVEHVYSILLKNENLKKAKIMKHHIEKGKSGASHEFDVFYELEIANSKHRVAIECKQYNRRIEKGLVQEFMSKLIDCNNIIGVMVASSDYQSGAKELAEHYGIKCLTVNDLPRINELLAFVVSTLIPDDSTIGDPFWSIMICRNNRNTGSYWSNDGQSIILFYSKKAADSFIAINELQNCSSFGITRQHLLGICAISQVFGPKILICPLLSSVIRKYKNKILFWEYSFSSLMNEYDLSN